MIEWSAFATRMHIWVAAAGRSLTLYPVNGMGPAYRNHGPVPGTPAFSHGDGVEEEVHVLAG